MLSMEVERTFDKYRKALIQDVTDKKQLEILVEEKLINIVEAFLQKAKEQLKRNFSPSVLYGLCLHLNAVITGKREKVLRQRKYCRNTGISQSRISAKRRTCRTDQSRIRSGIVHGRNLTSHNVFVLSK